MPDSLEASRMILKSKTKEQARRDTLGSKCACGFPRPPVTLLPPDVSSLGCESTFACLERSVQRLRVSFRFGALLLRPRKGPTERPFGERTLLFPGLTAQSRLPRWTQTV